MNPVVTLEDVLDRSFHINYNVKVDPLYRLKHDLSLLQQKHGLHDLYKKLKILVLDNNKKGYFDVNTAETICYPVLPTYTIPLLRTDNGTHVSHHFLGNAYKALSFLDYNQLNNPAQYIAEQLLGQDLTFWEEYLHPYVAFEFACILLERYPQHAHTYDAVSNLLRTHKQTAVKDDSTTVRSLLTSYIKRLSEQCYISDIIFNLTNTSDESLLRDSYDALAYFCTRGYIDLATLKSMRPASLPI